jgi:hypothetical protein
MTDRSVTLRYNPHHRTNIGPKETPAVRVYLSDPEGVTLQIRREREYMSASLSFADALAVADASAKPRRRAGHNDAAAHLINVRFGPVCRLKSDIF